MSEINTNQNSNYQIFRANSKHHYSFVEQTGLTANEQKQLAIFEALFKHGQETTMIYRRELKFLINNALSPDSPLDNDTIYKWIFWLESAKHIGVSKNRAIEKIESGSHFVGTNLTENMIEEIREKIGKKIKNAKIGGNPSSTTTYQINNSIIEKLKELQNKKMKFEEEYRAQESIKNQTNKINKEIINKYLIN